MTAERSVVLLKPDGLQRGLLGEIITRFERKGLKLVALKMLKLSDETLSSWYEHHKDKPFFGPLKSFMSSMPVVAMLWEGIEAVKTVRKLTGTTHGREAEAGSIRGDFSMSQQLNLIHASDSVETAQKEQGLVFTEEEIFDYEHAAMPWTYSEEERGE
ncbi:MAG: nucleoside-diphosphate kinase [Candidatus Chisholmbacteria bacterium]|nr:nucleoside-diphosphate kinase [Candidatus Chisholmbacteria bacterium]